MKIRLWKGVGFGIMNFKYRGFMDVYLVIFFFRIRIKRETNY